MSERNYYVLCDDKCLFEGMTKEQILAAITQAVEGHEIADVDTGFVTTLKEQNANTGLRFWVGTTAQYNALASKERNVLYILTDETPEEAFAEEFAEINERLQPLEEQAAKKGTIINTGANIPYGELSSEIEIGDLSGYSLVTVKHQLGKVTCQVNITSAQFTITGCTASLLSSSTTAQIAGVNITGRVENGRYYITENHSNKFQFLENGTPTVGGSSILNGEIIGIM